MAHSWVMAHADEAEAFRRYASLYGEQTVLLLDTYETIEAARQVVASGLRPAAVRLDSGDFAALSREVRRILDAGGLRETSIFLSGDLDEHRVDALVTGGAPVDGFGVGTALSTSSDAPALGIVYKLAEIERDGGWVPTAKASPGKATWPGRKQVWRVYRDARATEDVVALRDEPAPAAGERLLRCVMRDGRRLGAVTPLSDVRASCRHAIDRLPAGVKRLRNAEAHRVVLSERIRTQAARSSASPG